VVHACTPARLHACTPARLHACTPARLHACTPARLHACTPFMSAYEAPALDAVAFQLAAALDQYDHDVLRMMDAWIDIELYREVSDQVEKIRMYSSALPDVRVQWVELLIAHAELVHGLWRTHGARGGAPGESLDEVRQRHARAVAALRERCIRMVSRSNPR
jgi:hypothetical protein